MPNTMIAKALDQGEDATGLCTLRELVAHMLVADMTKCELVWEDETNHVINVMVEILQ